MERKRRAMYRPLCTVSWGCRRGGQSLAGRCNVAPVLSAVIWHNMRRYQNASGSAGVGRAMKRNEFAETFQERSSGKANC